MKYNFDEVISRKGTNCEKTDHCGTIFGHNNVLPMWIADMDFASPQPVTDAIAERIKHPILGYSFRSQSYNNAIIGWVKRHTNWTINPAWLDFSPGVVSGIVFAIRAFTTEGDGIVIQPPVYHPFARQIKLNNRRVINNPLIEINGYYTIDFEDLDIKLDGAKVFLMSNPHNPSSRVYTVEELTKIGQLCVKHNVIILSDEIHSDMVFSPHTHTHIASLCEEFAQRTITYIAPSKTFNIAGLSTSVVITPNDTLRRCLRSEFDKLHADQGNIFGAVALEAAYTHGDEWLEQLKEYIQGNINYIINFLAENIPSVKVARPEGTFLLWLDFRQWEMSINEMQKFMLEKAKLGLNEGSMFGVEGAGWWRMNIASQRAVITQAMEQLHSAYKELKGIK